MARFARVRVNLCPKPIELRQIRRVHERAGTAKLLGRTACVSILSWTARPSMADGG